MTWSTVGTTTPSGAHVQRDSTRNCLLVKLGNSTEHGDGSDLGRNFQKSSLANKAAHTNSNRLCVSENKGKNLLKCSGARQSCGHRLQTRVVDITLLVFLMCLESEASWLKKKQTTVASACPTGCATSTAWMPGGVKPFSLQARTRFLTPTNKERKKAEATLQLFLPTFKGISHASCHCCFPIPLCTVAALPGWESICKKKSCNLEQIVHKTETKGTTAQNASTSHSGCILV